MWCVKTPFALTLNWVEMLGYLIRCRQCLRASLVAQTVKNLPAMQQTWVQSLGQEDPLEKRMATNSSIF